MANHSDYQANIIKLGLIIPAVNTLSEPQFNKYAPDGMSVHVMRARIAGVPAMTLKDLEPRIEEASDLLMDAAPDAIVFHCTGTSMKEGVEGDHRIISQIHAATQLPTFSTIGFVVEAMRLLCLNKIAIISPYRSNRDAVSYLNEFSIQTVKDIALGFGGSGADYARILPTEWVKLACENDNQEIDGFFLSCTNTTQIEAIKDIEANTGKPVVNSNQAVLWGIARHFKEEIKSSRLSSVLGRLTGA